MSTLAFLPFLNPMVGVSSRIYINSTVQSVSICIISTINR
jgi:hypothetical protein